MNQDWRIGGGGPQIRVLHFGKVWIAYVFLQIKEISCPHINIFKFIWRFWLVKYKVR